MYIRSVRLTDLMLLGRMRRHTLRLNLPASLVSGFSPTRTAVVSSLPLGSGMRTFILGDRRPRAFIQVATRARGHKWEVLYLGSAMLKHMADADTHPWVHLLNYAAIAAGRRRVTRLLVKVPETAAEIVHFRQAGYQIYGRELIYTKVFAADDLLVEDGLELRPQSGSDAWLVHRLYFLTAPRGVQDAEAHTSHHWELRKARPGGLREQGWVVGDGTEAVAYARALSRWRAHQLEWIFQPAQRELFPRLVREAVARLPASPGDRVYCCLPEYQWEAADCMEEAGFVLSGTQALMVKYLAVKAAARERLFAPLKPAKARHVPSYLQTTVREESLVGEW